MFQGKDETDAGRLEKSDSKEEQPKNLKEWFHESKAVAKRLGSSKVYVLNNISGRADLSEKCHCLYIESRNKEKSLN